MVPVIVCSPTVLKAPVIVAMLLLSMPRYHEPQTRALLYTLAIYNVLITLDLTSHGFIHLHPDQFKGLPDDRDT